MCQGVGRLRVFGGGAGGLVCVLRIWQFRVWGWVMGR